MKIPLTTCAAAVLGITMVLAENIKTTTGQEYKDATISRPEPDGVVITFSAGIVKIPFTELSPEMQKKYGYNPNAAGIYHAEIERAAAQRETDIAAAKEKQRQFNLSGSTPTPAAEATHPKTKNARKGPNPTESTDALSRPAHGDSVTAQQPTPNVQSLSIDAHESGTASSFDVLWQTDWGSYNRDNNQAKKLLVSVHDMSRKIPRVDVEIFFIARDLKTDKFLIYKRTDIQVEMNGLIEVTGYVQSPFIKSNEQNYAALHENYASGLKMMGWIVRGKLNGHVFQSRASDQTLLEVAQGNPRQPFNLEALIAESDKAETKP